ncbi:MAG: 3-isopropylmalate dehydrogenase [Chloroflexi bacterium]|nr:3-isopropylmalate dehydrogenase [Chloroflexota bacterium]
MHAKITLLPGDGIGSEVVAEGVKVLRAIAAQFGHTFEFTEALIGGIAIDRTGNPLPPETLAACQASDAVLLGAVGGPKWSDPKATVRPEQGLLDLRAGLGLFANLRPVKIYPALIGASTLKPEVVANVDMVIVRELTGGLYFGKPQGQSGQAPNREAVDTLRYTEAEIARLMRVSFDLARSRRKKLTSVDKANVLASSRLWRTVAHEVAKDYPDVEIEDILVDACSMYLIRRPGDFDVIATENMFGDILSDEAAMLAGSMGMLPSASLGTGIVGAGLPPQSENADLPEKTRPYGSQSESADLPEKTRPYGLYEPIHGSAPDIAGQGIANPLATILSAAMMLRWSFGLEREADAVEAAVDAVLAAGYRCRDIQTPGCTLLGTQAMGDRVAEQLYV